MTNLNVVPQLVRVSKLATEADPPVSKDVMLRRLQALETRLGKKILFKTAGRTSPWQADVSFLHKLSKDGGRSIWDRLRAAEHELVEVKEELKEVRAVLQEFGYVVGKEPA